MIPEQECIFQMNSEMSAQKFSFGQIIKCLDKFIFQIKNQILGQKRTDTSTNQILGQHFMPKPIQEIQYHSRSLTFHQFIDVSCQDTKLFSQSDVRIN